MRTTLASAYVPAAAIVVSLPHQTHALAYSPSWSYRAVLVVEGWAASTLPWSKSEDALTELTKEVTKMVRAR